jgi:predicted Ser/Thr protein kinase
VTDRWARIGELFDRVVALPAAEREAALDASSADLEITREVRSLLEAHDSAGAFLDAPLPPPTESVPPPSADESLRAPGSELGPYRIVRMVGRGGMGIVYEAEDTRLHRRVALKSLARAGAGDDAQRHRLRQEARAAAALQHPGIATVYALEEIDGQLFISSEYLEGETLRDELRRGPLPPDVARRAAAEIARALAAAHERGIVHRDLKPENIVRTTSGVLKILDFGLAQITDPASRLVSQSRLTHTGLIVGTPAYMAPEQLLGRQTDFRADHFALGVMLFELCTGAHPFGEGSLPSTIARILADAPDRPPGSRDVPAGIWQIIERCLQKDPASRFASTRELLDALESHRSTFAAPEAPEALEAPDGPKAPEALLWWRFHQFAAAATYWAMVWPVWHVHRSFGRAGLFFFFATLAAVVVSANLRLHLWFSSRVYPEDLPAHRADVSRWIWWADIAYVALLVAGGIALPEDRAGWAAVLISVGVGSTVAFLLIEPATARAAFRRWHQV